jgi:hypothetical protein
MYSTLPHFVLGFHGCDKSVADRIIPSNKLHLQKSKNDYDWLGNGIYFWENDPVRALEYARFLRDHPEHPPPSIGSPKLPGLRGTDHFGPPAVPPLVPSRLAVFNPFTPPRFFYLHKIRPSAAACLAAQVSAPLERGPLNTAGTGSAGACPQPFCPLQH